MKKFKHLFLVLLSMCTFAACSDNDDDNNNEKEAAERALCWGEEMKGYDQSLKAFPDIFACYWEYTFNAEANPNVGLKIEGEYPNTRFFNFTIYNDETQVDESSIEDVNIKPNNGSVNPYVQENAGKNNKYTIYIIPNNTPSDKRTSMNNVCEFDKDVKVVSTILRHYIAQPDDMGGVLLPKITAFNVTTGKNVTLPKREMCGLRGDITVPGGAFGSAANMNFFRAPFSMMYPNRPTEYLYNRNTLEENEVMAFNFKAPHAPETVSEYPTADVRYWSICLGAQSTLSYNSIYDHNVKIDNNGMANFVIAAKNSANISNIRKKCEENGYNLMEWDRETAGKGIMILYRNMVINESFEHSMRQVRVFLPSEAAPYPTPATDFAHKAMGEWGPYGNKITEEQFLNASYTLSSIKR